ncbi:DNA polymerase IV [Kordiimonas laminariae]|uniref:DNA polymerase IV n=1 Tax=Kordiimonas laminariae TaxID=2917717 RepID=UPI001FF1C38C|nr:DNA polymerase IV [Kordiimonas laminariae]MCK0070867.1 DNA polymerase IV [Kordiimonas laminariae]
MSIRKIIHIDMDAFYASVAQRDNPELRGKPIAVGGGGERGVVMTASYEARAYGVRSAMPGRKAQELCPDIIFVPSNFDAYREASQKIRAIFNDYTDLVEPLSLDEAYLDVTENKHGIPYATQVAKEIRERIFKDTGLTSSAGISFNKFLAKTASDINKPNGMKVILPEDAPAFLEAMKIEKFHGIGKATAAKMHKLDIYTGADLKQLSEHELHQRFGKAGIRYYHIVRGNDNRAVNPDLERKSISVENTFRQDTKDKNILADELKDMSESLDTRIEKAKASGKTVTLKIKYSDFKSITRSITIDHPTADIDEILRLGIHLLDKVELAKTVRLIGIGISNLSDDNGDEEIPQLSLGI